MKKMSLFFTARVQHMMESYKDFAELPGLHKAIKLPSEILLSVLHNQCGVDGIESVKCARNIGGDAWRWFHLGYPEYRDLHSAVHSAQRIESTISFYTETIFEVRIEFFRKNQKKFFYAARFSVNLTTAEVSALFSVFDDDAA